MTEIAGGSATRVERDDRGVVTVTLDNPRRRNALDWDTFAALERAAMLAGEPGGRALVLRGEGPSFCSGLDRALLAGLATADPEHTRESGRRLQSVFDALEAVPVPTLAIVQGACIGGGLALLLVADFRVVSTDTVVSMQEMRYAFVPDLGHVHRLQREVGATRAKELVFFGERVGADTLATWGVVNEVVPPAELAAAGQRWADRCAATPPRAVAAAKRIMLSDPGGQDGAASQRAALEANLGGLIGGRDFVEGMTAALEGRPPLFTGAP